MSATRWRAGLAALCLVISSAAVAQVTTADIVGRVTDSSNAVLPGATVTVENVGTHETRVAPTNESGDVTNTPSFANPNAGLGAPGFGTITSTGNSIPRQ